MFKAVLEVLMAETAGITGFRDVTPSRLLDGYERFVGNFGAMKLHKLSAY